MSEAAHDVYHHRDGTKCIWIDDGGYWFVPYDVGGEGYVCEKRHASEVTFELKEKIDQPTEAKVFHQGKMVFEGVDKSILLKTALFESILREAIIRLQNWVEHEIHDWYDPVISPAIHDDLRLVLGMEPEDRDE